MVLLFFVFFVFTAQQSSVSADFELPKTQYPGLTLAEARCPETVGDEDSWQLVPYYNNTPLCFKRKPLPANLCTVNDVEAVCQKEHDSAIPARLFHKPELSYVYRLYLTKNAVIGYFTDDKNKEAISKNEDVVYVENGQVQLTNIATLSADPTGKAVLCMMPAYPRFMHSYYYKPISPAPDLAEYTCEGEGWDLQASCGGTPFCYKTVEYSNFPLFKTMLTEFNVCGMKEPNSFVASIHCQKEHDYIKSKLRTVHQIGIFIPHRGPWNQFDSWQWVDGTPIDFVLWNRHEPNNCENENEKNAIVANHFDFIDDNLRKYERPALCKKKAVKKNLPLDVKRNDVFKVKGKRCLFERGTHWNRRCPTNSSLWQIIQSDGGVHCYALVNAPVPLTTDNFNHEICHDLHPQAKLASIHYDQQFGFLYPLTSQASKIIIGLLPNSQTFVWADGTFGKKSYWAQTEPRLNSSDSVVRIDITKHTFLNSCPKTPMDRPLFKTMKMEDVKADMQIACKIKAEPLLACAPVPDADGMESMTNTACPDGWTKERFCDKVYCYKRVHVVNEFQSFDHAVERDYCHVLDPEAHLASIHCIEEHFYVQGYAAQTLIGLHIPTKFHNDTFDVKNFEWTDGTLVDFVGWNRFSYPETTDLQYAPLFPKNISENIKFSHVYNKKQEKNSGWSNDYFGYQRVLCKKKATVISNL